MIFCTSWWPRLFVVFLLVLFPRGATHTKKHPSRCLSRCLITYKPNFFHQPRLVLRHYLSRHQPLHTCSPFPFPLPGVHLLPIILPSLDLPFPHLFLFRYCVPCSSLLYVIPVVPCTISPSPTLLCHFHFLFLSLVLPASKSIPKSLLYPFPIFAFCRLASINDLLKKCLSLGRCYVLHSLCSIFPFPASLVC